MQTVPLEESVETGRLVSRSSVQADRRVRLSRFSQPSRSPDAWFASGPSPYPPPPVRIPGRNRPGSKPVSTASCALRVEVVPPPPRETVVWEPGRWHWDGRRYVWIGGHYVERVVGRHWECETLDEERQ
jgi:WXXGXW repeat (2 copies)